MEDESSDGVQRGLSGERKRSDKHSRITGEIGDVTPATLDLEGWEVLSSAHSCGVAPMQSWMQVEVEQEVKTSARGVSETGACPP